MFNFKLLRQKLDTMIQINWQCKNSLQWGCLWYIYEIHL